MLPEHGCREAVDAGDVETHDIARMTLSGKEGDLQRCGRFSSIERRAQERRKKHREHKLQPKYHCTEL
jgi:hypothetical protein